MCLVKFLFSIAWLIDVLGIYEYIFLYNCLLFQLVTRACIYIFSPLYFIAEKYRSSTFTKVNKIRLIDFFLFFLFFVLTYRIMWGKSITFFDRSLSFFNNFLFFVGRKRIFFNLMFKYFLFKGKSYFSDIVTIVSGVRVL